MVLFPAELERQFIVEKHIGGGCYGAIYRVIKKSNKKIYAMKVVSRNNSSSWKDVEIEMQVLSFVNPYKLHLDCFFVKDDTFYMIINYCPNGDLLKAICDTEEKNEKFKEDEIWKYFIQICFGLECLHCNEFIHRDLHLQNILLDENRNIKIADFGISRYMGTYSIQGAQAIRSPGVLRGDIQSKESDIWAVGYCLYYLCTLEDPFNKNPNRQHRPISSEYSEDLRHFVDWCLKKERRERPKIADILTNEFIIRKTQSLNIEVPQTSVMNTEIFKIELRKELEDKDMKIDSLNLKLKSSNKEIMNQKAEIDYLRVEIARLNNENMVKGNDECSLCAKIMGLNDDKFCEKCGTVSKTYYCLTCNSIMEKNKLICKECGNNFWKCEFCNKLNKPDEISCNRCRGKKISKPFKNSWICNACSKPIESGEICGECFYDNSSICSKTTGVKDHKFLGLLVGDERLVRAQNGTNYFSIRKNLNDLNKSDKVLRCEDKISKFLMQERQPKLAISKKSEENLSPQAIYPKQKAQKCHICARDLTISEERNCSMCGKRTGTGRCYNCKIDISPSAYICNLCTKAVWICSCGKSNSKFLASCHKCGNNR